MARALRILTWNTWLQSDPTSDPKPNAKKRAPLIAEGLCSCDRDILLLQKVWSSRSTLTSMLKPVFPYLSKKINDKRGLNLHAGLLTASRFKLRLLGTIDFKETLGMEGAFSNKGAALWEGVWQGHAFQITSVHLQGHVKGRKKEAKLPATRRAQLRQLRDDLLEPNCRRAVPQIICGDFSIDHGTDRYEELERILGAEGGPVTGKIPHTAYGREKGRYRNDIGRDFIDEPETLDHILLRRNGGHPGAVTIKRSVRRFQDDWSVRKMHKVVCYKDLAYRYALQASVTFR